MSESKQTRNHGSSREKGVYTVLFLLILPLLIGSLGLGVDMAHFWWTRGQLQNAADAAAFAGAKDLNGTSDGRTRATGSASSFAVEHKVDGVTLVPTEVITNTTGRWDFTTKSFLTTNVTHPSANAIQVTVQRQNVPSFFSGFFANAASSQTVAASAVAVAGGAGGVGCAAPLAISACIFEYGLQGDLICPTNLTFQSEMHSIGLTLPDGTGPVSGNKAQPFFIDMLADPNGCAHPAEVGDTLQLQDGNDMSQNSVTEINKATNDGKNPVVITIPVVDTPCENSGPSYNQEALIVGFLRMNLVGATYNKAVPKAVKAACPDIEGKNVCITADCSVVDSPGGGTTRVRGEKVYLVN
jgi:Flp pilus assembly protein TadG